MYSYRLLLADSLSERIRDCLKSLSTSLPAHTVKLEMAGELTDKSRGCISSTKYTLEVTVAKKALEHFPDLIQIIGEKLAFPKDLRDMLISLVTPALEN